MKPKLKLALIHSHSRGLNHTEQQQVKVSPSEPNIEANATSAPTRASNDPRSKPKAIAKVETSSEGRTSKKAAPTTSDSPVVTAAKESAPVKRASNDPRQKRAVEKNEEKPSEG